MQDVCTALNCLEEIPRFLLFCRGHWDALPDKVRREMRHAIGDMQDRHADTIGRFLDLTSSACVILLEKETGRTFADFADALRWSMTQGK